MRASFSLEKKSIEEGDPPKNEKFTEEGGVGELPYKMESWGNPPIK